jgi:hypothetical protein
MIKCRVEGKKESMMLEQFLKSRKGNVIGTIEANQILAGIPITNINHLSLTINHYNYA